MSDKESNKQENNNSSIVTIKLGEEHNIKVEEMKDFSKSFFKNVYRDTFDCIFDIINQKEDDENNNIIAFLGDRGTGKTSSMMTVAKALGSGYIVSSELREKLGTSEFDSGEDKKYKFHVLDSIDPSMFDDNDSIIDVVVAEMFSKFKDKIDNADSFNNLSTKRKLLEKFSEVHKSLRVINTDKKDRFNVDGNTENVINTLTRLSSGLNLRKTFKELVDEYLKTIYGVDNDKGNYLVLPIDDLDMNLRFTEDMCEQIRKYLMVSNVIILISSRYEQLRDIIEKSFVESFDSMIKAKRPISEDFKGMADKYLTKLIPDDRRMFLPQINHIESYSIKNTKLKIVDRNNDELPISKKMTELKLEEQILKLIHDKTGLIFLKREHGIHPLIPKNLRELHTFVSMLCNMKSLEEFEKKKEKETDIEKTDKEERKKSVNMENINKFESYFKNNWINRNVESVTNVYVDNTNNQRFNGSKINIIDGFIKTNLEYKNKFIVNQLTNRIECYTKDKNTRLHESYESYKKKIRIIADLNNNHFNISIGDVLYVLDLYERYISEDENFVFTIKTLYSIELYRLLKIDKDRDSAKKLIGGNVFGEFIYDFLRKHKKTYERVIFKIEEYKQTKELKNHVDNVNQFRREIKGRGKKSVTVNKKMIDSINKIHWLHFFTYLGSDVDEQKDRDSNIEEIVYREKSKFEYYEKSPYVYPIAYFNILAFVFYILDSEGVKNRLFKPKEIEGTNDEEEKSKDKELDLETIIKGIYNSEDEYKCLDELLDKKISEWAKNYDKDYCVLPIYSLEYIDKFREIAKINSEKSVSKSEEKSYFKTHLKELFNKGFKGAIKEIDKSNKWLKSYDKDNDKLTSKLLDKFSKCPIVKVILESKDINIDMENIIETLYAKSLVDDRIKRLNENKINIKIKMDKYKYIFKEYLKHNNDIENIVTRTTFMNRGNELKEKYKELVEKVKAEIKEGININKIFVDNIDRLRKQYDDLKTYYKQVEIKDYERDIYKYKATTKEFLEKNKEVCNEIIKEIEQEKNRLIIFVDDEIEEILEG